MNTTTPFEAACERLNSLVHMGIKLGLENTYRLVAALGNPQDKLRFVHVAGTNGKGSVCALLAAALQRSGYRVGLFTSPHLVSVRERIRVDGKSISEADFADVVSCVDEQAQRLFDSGKGECPTYFEFTTAMALVYFLRREVDLVLFEVGLGGRLDSTNIVTPMVSVVTSIDLEHTEMLGTTLDQIAGEKGGIIKPRVPVVIGERKKEPVDRLLRLAAEREAPALLIGRDFDAGGYEIDSVSFGNWRQANRIRWKEQELVVPTGLVGRHQAANTAVAWAVLQLLRDAGVPTDEAAVREGLLHATWPARLQVLPDGLIFDAAHNPAGMAATAASLQQLQPGRQYNVMLGVLKDKQWKESLDYLVPLCRSLRLLRINQPRTASPWEVKAFVRQRWPELPVKVCRNIDTGLSQIRALGDGLVIGSIYFAGEVLDRYYHGQPVEL